jgi:hypothetical protein
MSDQKIKKSIPEGVSRPAWLISSVEHELVYPFPKSLKEIHSERHLQFNDFIKWMCDGKQFLECFRMYASNNLFTVVSSTVKKLGISNIELMDMYDISTYAFNNNTIYTEKKPGIETDGDILYDADLKYMGFPYNLDKYITHYGYKSALGTQINNEPYKNYDITVKIEIWAKNRERSRYLLIMIILNHNPSPFNKISTGHANCVLFDREKTTCYYFEPHGGSDKSIAKHCSVAYVLGHFTHNKLRWKFETNIKHAIAVWQGHDPLCGSWSFLWAMLYVNNPEIEDMMGVYNAFARQPNLRNILLFTFLYHICSANILDDDVKQRILETQRLTPKSQEELDADYKRIKETFYTYVVTDREDCDDTESWQ